MAYGTFQKYLDSQILKYTIVVSDEDTKTATQAAQVHNVPVSNIVKSLLVWVNGSFKLFLVPGDRRLDLESVKARFKTDDIRMANAKEVKDITGYSIGGVPPFGHSTKIETYIEDGFDVNTVLVAAAGSGNSVFKISYSELEKIVRL
jgi:prolyl-tRNA editing enzyme YbaK/EbsC (Cys-tRNA(Pro) deacylase)